MFGKEFYIVIIYFEKVIFNRLIIDYKFIRNHIILNGKLYRDVKQSLPSIRWPKQLTDAHYSSSRPR